MSSASTPTRKAGEPAWEIARLFPNQGGWTEEEYFDLSRGSRLVEFSDGFVEVLPMPTTSHQMIVYFLCEALRAYLREHPGGLVLFAPLKVRLRSGKYREPDVMFMKDENRDRVGEEFWEGADLVMEIVSESNRSHDLEFKRAEYAEAGIPEYWVVDPHQGRILVLTLEPGATESREHGSFGKGDRATSRLLPGFSVDVAEAVAPRV